MKMIKINKKIIIIKKIVVKIKHKMKQISSKKAL